MTDELLPTSGLVAGKYELIGMIGRGGMGSVWEARHVSLGTRFAIKFIEAEYADSQEARSRFDKEARAAATIQSKHAIQIYDHGVTGDGKPYIVMELLEGEPLDKRLDRVGRLTLQETARIIGQVSRGLARAHERGIIHRDLKPENIFLVRTPDDDEEVAKVLDFGIAKVQASAANPAITSSTKTGAILGTPFYMSPEQARGLRNVDHRTDVWSLGVIAFRCVTGRLPFDGESVGDLLVKICTAEVPVPSQVAPGIPPAFDAWFARALEREPDRRFGTVAELADALAFSAGVAARGPGSFQPNSGSPSLSPQNTQPAGQNAAYSSGEAAPFPTTRAGGITPTPIAPTIDGGPSLYGTPPPAFVNTPQGRAAHGRSGGPVAGSLTSNGLSSSQNVTGFSAGRGNAKYVVFAALSGLGLAMLGTVGFLKLRATSAASTTASAVAVMPPPGTDPVASVASGTSPSMLKLEPAAPVVASAAQVASARNTAAKGYPNAGRPNTQVAAQAPKPPPIVINVQPPSPIVFAPSTPSPVIPPKLPAPKPPGKPDQIGY